MIRPEIRIVRANGSIQVPEGYRTIVTLTNPEISYYACNFHTHYWQPFHKGAALGLITSGFAIEQIVDQLPTTRYIIADLVSDCIALDTELHELREDMRLIGPYSTAAIQTRIDFLLEVKREILSITLDKPEQFRKVQ